MTKRKTKQKQKKLTLEIVQRAFNQAIVRRDGRCIITGRTNILQCSHFFAAKRCPALRFFPANAHTQAAGVHLEYHQAQALEYTVWMQNNVPELDWMWQVWRRKPKYTHELLAEIKRLCEADKLAELQTILTDIINGLA